MARSPCLSPIHLTSLLVALCALLVGVACAGASFDEQKRPGSRSPTGSAVDDSRTSGADAGASEDDHGDAGATEGSSGAAGGANPPDSGTTPEGSTPASEPSDPPAGGSDVDGGEGDGTGSSGTSPGTSAEGDASSTTWEASVTLLGTTDADQYGNAVAFDNAGNLYVGGTAYGIVEGIPVHSASDGFVSKYDSNLNHLWTRTVSANGAQAVEDLVVVGDHVYGAGTTFGNLSGFDQLSPYEGDVFVVSFSLEGEQEWLLQAGTVAEEKGKAIAVLAGDGIYIAGHTTGTLTDPDAFGEDHDALLLKVSLQGALLWQRQWGDDDLDMANDVIAVPGQGVVAVGATFVPGADHFDATVARFSSTGTNVWKESFGGTGHDFADRVVQLSSGELLVVGARGSALDGTAPIDGSDLSLTRLRMSAEILDEMLLPAAGTAEAHAVLVTTEGGVLLAGQTTGCLTTACGNSELDALFLETSLAGVGGFGWQWGGAQQDWFTSLALGDGPDGPRVAGVGSACIGSGACDASGDRQLLLVVFSPMKK